MQTEVKRGKLIVFEGIDGVGKSTQIKKLTSYLEEEGHEVVASFEPTNGEYGAAIRQTASTGRLSLEEEYRLFSLDRQEHVAQLIEPSLAAGKYVLLDRYYFSTLAYQGARGGDIGKMRAEQEAFAIQPDLVLLLDLTVEESLKRIGARGNSNGEAGADAFENEEMLTKVRNIFMQFLTDTSESVLFARIKANQDVESIAEDIELIIYQILYPESLS